MERLQWTTVKRKLPAFFNSYYRVIPTPTPWEMCVQVNVFVYQSPYIGETGYGTESRVRASGGDAWSTRCMYLVSPRSIYSPFLTLFSLLFLTFLTLGTVLRCGHWKGQRMEWPVQEKKWCNSPYPTDLWQDCCSLFDDWKGNQSSWVWGVFLPHSKNHHTHCFISFSNIFSNAVWVPALVSCSLLEFTWNDLSGGFSHVLGDDFFYKLLGNLQKVSQSYCVWHQAIGRMVVNGLVMNKGLEVKRKGGWN